MFGMFEASGGAGLGLEPRQFLRSGELAAQDHLEGDGALKAALPRLVDDAHAAAAQLIEQVVVAEGSRR